jgi:hypothetical protein
MDLTLPEATVPDKDALKQVFFIETYYIAS